MARIKVRKTLIGLIIFLVIMVTSANVFASDLPAPTNFTVSAVNYNSLYLKWDPVSGAFAYVYLISTSPDITGVPEGSKYYDKTSVTITGLSPGTTYYCRVCAVRDDGEYYTLSALSPTVSAVPMVPTPQNMAVTSTGYNSLRVGWTAVAGATGYQIRWKTGLNAWSSPINVTTNNYIHSNLFCGTAYSYQTCAYVSAGQNTYYSNWSNTASGTPIPAVPTGGSAYSLEYDTLHLSWHAVDGASGYQFQRKLGLQASWPDLPDQSTTSTTYNDGGLLTGSTYYYRVRAYRTVSKSLTVYGNWSDSISGKPMPANPLWLSVTSMGYDTLELNWASVLGANGYYIQKALSDSGPWTTLQYMPTVTRFSDSGLVTGKTYFYKVCAYHIENKTTKEIGSWSATSSGTPIPAKPSGLGVTTIDADSLSLSWSAVAGAEGYAIERATSASGSWKEIYRTEKLGYTDNGLPASTLLYYRVRAYKGSTFGNYCNAVSGKTADIAPTTTSTTTEFSPSPTPGPSESESSATGTTAATETSPVVTTSVTDTSATDTQSSGTTSASGEPNSTTNQSSSESITVISDPTSQDPTSAASTTSGGGDDKQDNQPFPWAILILSLAAGGGVGVAAVSLITLKKKTK